VARHLFEVKFFNLDSHLKDTWKIPPVAKTKAVTPPGFSFAATQIIRKANVKMADRHDDLLKKCGIEPTQDGRYGEESKIKILRVDRHGTIVKFRVQVWIFWIFLTFFQER